jgi:hypothetical protein
MFVLVSALYPGMALRACNVHHKAYVHPVMPHFLKCALSITTDPRASQHASIALFKVTKLVTILVDGVALLAPELVTVDSVSDRAGCSHDINDLSAVRACVIEALPLGKAVVAIERPARDTHDCIFHDKPTEANKDVINRR